MNAVVEQEDNKSSWKKKWLLSESGASRAFTCSSILSIFIQKIDTTNEMQDLTDFTGEGLFEMSKEEQNRYTEMIYEICLNSLKDLQRMHPNENMKLHFLLNLHEVREHFVKEEDYEMSYLINETMNKINGHEV